MDEKTEEKVRARNVRRIVKAAIAVFSRKGFDGTRIAEIAATAGLPKANIYYYFSSKEEIYSAIITQLIAGWDDALSHIRPDREPEEALSAYIRAKLDYSRRHPEESRLFAGEIIQGARFLTRRDRAHMRSTTEKYVPIVDGWIRDGRVQAVSPHHLFIMLWSMTQFYADFELLAADALGRKKLKAEDFEEAADTITRTILDGLLTPSH
ncbi:MAG: TetR family transcriptional regulator C-terminal domain-containing protein [Shinella sp.]|nr:TetR family transcriptional regulator C-terminal domain-containing protein [Shinella sp.]